MVAEIQSMVMDLLKADGHKVFTYFTVVELSVPTGLHNGRQLKQTHLPYTIFFEEDRCIVTVDCVPICEYRYADPCFPDTLVKKFKRS